MYKPFIVCLFAFCSLILVSCSPHADGFKTDEDTKAREILQHNTVNTFVHSVRFTDYFSARNLKDQSAEIVIGGWFIHPALDSTFAFQLVSSNLSSRLFDYCIREQIEPDTIRVIYKTINNSVSTVYDTDLLYPVEALYENSTAFVNALQTQNTVEVDKLFTLNVRHTQSRGELIRNMLAIGKMYPLSSTDNIIKYIGFTFPYAPSNTDLYQFTYAITNPKDTTEFYLMDLLVDHQNRAICNLSIYPLN